jgi:hypothetical protein
MINVYVSVYAVWKRRLLNHHKLCGGCLRNQISHGADPESIKNIASRNKTAQKLQPRLVFCLIDNLFTTAGELNKRMNNIVCGGFNSAPMIQRCVGEYMAHQQNQNNNGSPSFKGQLVSRGQLEKRTRRCFRQIGRLIEMSQH